MKRMLVRSIVVIGTVIAGQAVATTAPGAGGQTQAAASFAVTTASGATSAIGGDALGSYVGTIDKNGNFSFNLVGTTRRVCFNFETPLPLLAPPRIPDATPPTSGCYAVAFTTVASASGTGLPSILPGQTALRDVRFNWNNLSAAAPDDPSNYHLGFRGDLDEDGLVDTSRVMVTCEAGNAANACTHWTLEPCVDVQGVCGPDAVAVNDDGSSAGAAVGQVGGGFPKGRGTTTIERYVMPWRMSVVRN